MEKGTADLRSLVPNMINITRLNSIIFLCLFVVFAIATRLANKLGLYVAGFDYLIWFATVVALVSLIFGVYKKKIRLIKSYLILLFILALFCFLNFFVAEVRTLIYLQGTFFSFLFAFNFLLFYNLGIEKEDFFFILKGVVIIITLMAIMAYLERFFSPGYYRPYVLRGVDTVLKDPAALATLLNVNILACFVLFMRSRNSGYLFLIVFSILTIALLLFLKALILVIFICLIFINFYFRSRMNRFLLYTFFVLSFVGFVFSGQTLVEEISGRFETYFGGGRDTAPRNVLYVTAYEIGKDYFPFGSGQGTFGSYPVGKNYSEIYYKYGISNVYGLGKADALGKTDSQFIFDTYWSSILGEMGFIASFFFLWLWLFPALGAYKSLKDADPDVRGMAFFLVMSTIVIFIESIASPAAGQLLFILIYAGLGGMTARYLDSMRRKEGAQA
jgi:hypothetical protein